MRQLAELTGIEYRTVARALKPLVPTPGKQRALLYESRDALPLLYGEVKGKHKNDLELQQERARLARAQANVTEIQEAELRGQVVRAEVAIAHWQNLVSISRAKLLSMPAKIAHLVLGAATIGEAETIVRNEVEAALNELADTAGPAEDAQFRSDGGVEDVASPAEADDEPVGGQAPPPVVRNVRRARAVAD
jgi:phage terminase Nu1 subunit (DNA packaging protein)